MDKQLRINSMNYLVFSLIQLMLLLANVESRANVNINKCCRVGDVLNVTMTEITCTVGGGSMKWAPRVLFPLRESFYNNTGELPVFMSVTEETFPTTCKTPEVFRDILIVRNGSLYVTDKDILVDPKDYCVDKDVALVCRSDLTTANSSNNTIQRMKINKCCGRNQIYNEVSSTSPCVSYNKTLKISDTNVNLDISFGFPDCPSNEFAIIGEFKSELYKSDSGFRTVSGKVFQLHQICIEQSSKSGSLLVLTCSEHYSRIPLVVERPPNEEDTRFVIYSMGLFISVIFLIATLLISFMLLTNHHALHWRCQTNYIGCLLVGDLLLAVTQIAGSSLTGPACLFSAHMMHFFFLAAFFWLNTMCFNIWWTFRDFRPSSLEKNQEQFRLRVYEIYAWGVPILITVFAAVLDNLPDYTGDTFPRPRFGESKCWFYGDIEIFAYFFGPIGLLLCINVLLFLSTARQLTCGLWKRDDVKSTSERAALGRICMKLVIVMGVTWIADVVSWAVGGPNYIWYVTDIINALQGVFIFIVVGCQPQVWLAFKRYWSSCIGSGQEILNTNTANGIHHSSYSNGMQSMDGSMHTTSTTAFSYTSGSAVKIPIETMC